MRHGVAAASVLELGASVMPAASYPLTDGEQSGR
jgi:hypothetical protein